MDKKLFLLISLFFILTVPHGLFAKGENGNYTYTERTDLRRYDNGKYTGLTSREIRSFITKSPENNSLYDGNFYVWQETRRNMQSVKSKIHEAIPSVFKIENNGSFTMIQDNGFPSFRSFPSLPAQKLSAGDMWTATSVRSVDPKGDGTFSLIPFVVEYTYTGDSVYNGNDVYVLKARWATRYDSAASVTEPLQADPALLRANGTHSASIYISKKSGAALVVHDLVDETFLYQDGSFVNYKGTISLFTDYPPSVDHKKVIQAAKKQKPDTQDLPVEQTAAGLKISIQNLKFKPDSAELLPEEEERLDQIAQVLKTAPDSMFLVEGHTASTGQEQSEMELSLERAKAIALSLSKRGIPEEKFICKGWGATKPAADNSTKEGMAANRRVEITILE